MFTFRLALRNVFRQYGRTTLSMVSIVAGVFLLILGRGLIGGMKENIIRAQIDTSSGHVQARPADYPKAGLRNPVDKLLKLTDQRRKWLDKNSEAWAPRLIFISRVVHNRDAIRARIIGVHPELDETVFPRTDWKLDGKVPKDVDDGVLIAPGLARAFKVKKGDQLIFETRTSAGAINALQMPVDGVLRTGNPAFDRIGVMMSLAAADKLVQAEGKRSHVSLKLDNRDASKVMAAKLKAAFGEGEAGVRTWQDETDGLVRMQDLRQAVMDIIALSLMAIAAAGIANTVLMAAYERVREIGTLRAMGMTRGGVVRLFVAEGTVMGVVGSSIGALLGWLTVGKYSRDGIDMSAMIEQAGQGGTYDDIPFSVMLYMQQVPGAVVGAVIFGLLVAVLASIYPAIVATRMQPADAVRAQ